MTECSKVLILCRTADVILLAADCRVIVTGGASSLVILVGGDGVRRRGSQVEG